MAVQRDGQAASLRGFGKRWSARLPAGASASSPTGRSLEPSPEAPARHLPSAPRPLGHSSRRRDPTRLVTPTSMIGLCQEGKSSPDALRRSAGVNPL
jgi:hypothetical protein